MGLINKAPHLLSWRAILSAPFSPSFLMAPLSRCSRSADAADPPEFVFRSDRPLAAAASRDGSVSQQCRQG